MKCQPIQIDNSLIQSVSLLSTIKGHHIVQHLGRDAVVVLEKHRLPMNIEEYGRGTGSIHLRYQNGLAQSIGKTRSIGVER